MGHVKRLLPFLVALSLIHPASEIPPVYLDYFEQFGGDAAVSRGLRLLGYYGATFDLRICSFHDFLVPAGFLATLRACMRLRRRGLAWFAPPCSTWVWMSRSSTGRAERVTGNPENENVQAQNMLVRRLLHLLTMLIKRGCYFVIEQPGSSVMFNHPAVEKFKKRWERYISQAKLQMGHWTLESQKDTILWGWVPSNWDIGITIKAI